jgi:hypothetical protein
MRGCSDLNLPTARAGERVDDRLQYPAIVRWLPVSIKALSLETIAKELDERIALRASQRHLTPARGVQHAAYIGGQGDVLYEVPRLRLIKCEGPSIGHDFSSCPPPPEAVRSIASPCALID